VNTNPAMIEDDVQRIVRQMRESALWYDTNYYGEFEQVWLAAKCKTRPITIKDDEGKEIEDRTRTNVAMPDIAAIVRRNTARMTAQPPTNNYICRSNIDLADRLSAWANYQYDRSGEDKVQHLHVLQAETFGYSVTKLFWDKVVQVRPFRKLRAQVTDREPYLQEAGVPPDQIPQMIRQLGATMSPEEIAQSVLENGDEIIVNTPLKKYEGPAQKFIFIGDLYCESGFRTLNESAYVIERFIENDKWLDMMAATTYVDPTTNEEKTIFDPVIVKDFKELRSDPSSLLKSRPGYDLRTRLRESLNITEPRVPPEIVRGQRYEILEHHEMREDGRIWITWVGNEKVKLGEMPYLFDLGGRYMYTEYVPMPDLLFGIGDSTPRLGRFLYFLHNTVVNQRTDLINNILRRVVFRRHGADIPDEAVERSLFRIYDVKDPADFVVQPEPDVPESAWESEAAVMRQMALLDGVLNNVESGTAMNPMAGKTATTAVLQQRSVDTMTAAKLSAYNLYLKEIGEKKLMMLQQMLREAVQIPSSYIKNEGIIQRYGRPAVINLDPYEIQDDIEVEPEAGSTLSVDDEFRRMSAMQLYQLAEGDPAVWNKFEVAKVVAATIKGCDAAKVINQPQPPPPPVPKGAINLSIKFQELPLDSQQVVLQMMGLPPSQILQQQADFATQHATSQAMLDHIGKAGDAAEAAHNMTQPSTPEPSPMNQPPGATPMPQRGGGMSVTPSTEGVASHTLAR
jgi:hypothetical protein